MIVDKRFIVEGSANWSDNAFADNFESSSLIDSKKLAKTKIKRLKNLPLIGQPKRVHKKETYHPQNNGILPESVVLPKALITNKKYLPSMVPKVSNRAFDIYLLLVRESILREQKIFFLNLEYMATLLNMPKENKDKANRRLIIKVLKQLQEKYQLIDLELHDHKDAKITIKSIKGDRFVLPAKLIEPDTLNKYGPSASMILLIKECLKTEGTWLRLLKPKQIKKRFHLGKKAQINGRRILESR